MIDMLLGFVPMVGILVLTAIALYGITKMFPKADEWMETMENRLFGTETETVKHAFHRPEKTVTNRW